MVARMEWKAKGKEKGNRIGKGILISLICLVWSRNIDSFVWLQKWNGKGKENNYNANEQKYPPLENVYFIELKQYLSCFVFYYQILYN